MSLPLFLTLAAVLLHIAGIAAAMHAVMYTRTPQGAFAWVLGLVLLPYATLLPYLYLGRSRFHGYVDKHRLHRQHLELARVSAGDTMAAECERFASLTTMLGAT